MESYNPLTVIAVVVGLAVLSMLAINIYLTLKGRKDDSQENSSEQAQYMVLHQRLDSFAELLNKQLEQGRQASEKATFAVSQQVQGFTQGITQLQEGLKNMHESVKGVSSFQDLFRNPKLRGQWGEMSLEASLAQYFPKDKYIIQHYFTSGEAVDAALKLPNNLLLPIDSKFNWDNFQKMINSDNDIHRDGFRKLFYADVKKKIDEISSKYILPSENTTDFALMFVPAETVYYEIINNLKDVDVPEYARKKKVIMVSPSTFALSVSAIHHWYKDVQINQKTQEIIKKLERVVADSGKLSDDFRKLGNHISNARSAYDDSEKRLGLMVGRVQNVIQIGHDQEVSDSKILDEGK